MWIEHDRCRPIAPFSRQRPRTFFYSYHLTHPSILPSLSLPLHSPFLHPPSTPPSRTHTSQKMVNKPPKPVKAPKANKRSKASGSSNADLPFQKNYFSEESLFGRSQKFVQENDAKPFRDFGYFIAFILGIFIWRYQAALSEARESKLLSSQLGTGNWTLSKDEDMDETTNTGRPPFHPHAYPTHFLKERE